jgi:hypothetical protein
MVIRGHLSGGHLGALLPDDPDASARCGTSLLVIFTPKPASRATGKSFYLYSPVSCSGLAARAANSDNVSIQATIQHPSRRRSASQPGPEDQPARQICPALLIGLAVANALPKARRRGTSLARHGCDLGGAAGARPRPRSTSPGARMPSDISPRASYAGETHRCQSGFTGEVAD